MANYNKFGTKSLIVLKNTILRTIKKMKKDNKKIPTSLRKKFKHVDNELRMRAISNYRDMK